MEEQWMEEKIGTYVFLKLPKHSKRLGQLKGEGKMWIAKQEITMAFVQKRDHENYRCILFPTMKVGVWDLP